MVAVSLEGVADRIRQRGVGEKVWCVDLLQSGETEKMWTNDVSTFLRESHSYGKEKVIKGPKGNSWKIRKIVTKEDP